MGSMDGYRDMLEREVERSRADLQRQASRIAEQVGYIADRLKVRDMSISEIGELQGQGPRFDVACATYTRAVRALKDYDGFAALASKETST